MSGDLLWYLARISGLMALILAFGALSAGLLLNSRPAWNTAAGQWAIDTHRFLGRSALLAVAVHTGTIVADDRFGLTIVNALTGADADGTTSAALAIGTVCGWTMLLTELARLAEDHLPRWFDRLALVALALIVVGGAVHAWQLGSDTRNPAAIAVAAVCALVLAGTAALGTTSLVGQTPADDSDRAGSWPETPSTAWTVPERTGWPAEHSGGVPPSTSVLGDDDGGAVAGASSVDATTAGLRPLSLSRQIPADAPGETTEDSVVGDSLRRRPAPPPQHRTGGADED
ncbi:MAG: hypothetical protein AAF547_17790 [Actinomycetota bacterium]